MIGNYKGKIKSSSQMKMTSWGDWEGTGEEGLLAACGWEVDAEILASKDVPLNVNSVGKLPKQVPRPTGGWGRDVSTGSTEPAAGSSCLSLGWISPSTPNFGAISGNTITN